MSDHSTNEDALAKCVYSIKLQLKNRLLIKINDEGDRMSYHLKMRYFI